MATTRHRVWFAAHLRRDAVSSGHQIVTKCAFVGFALDHTGEPRPWMKGASQRIDVTLVQGVEVVLDAGFGRVLEVRRGFLSRRIPARVKAFMDFLGEQRRSR